MTAEPAQSCHIDPAPRKEMRKSRRICTNSAQSYIAFLALRMYADCVPLELAVSQQSILTWQGLSGVHAALVCPLREDSTIHTTDLEAHVQVVAASDGMRGLLLNGHAGEGHLLSPEEKRDVIGIARSATGPSTFITAGITSEATRDACCEAQIAAAAGADAVLVFPPSHWCRGVDDDSVLAHHSAVMAACGLPILLYRAPISWGSLSYAPQLIAKLIDHDMVAGIKEGSWDVAAYEEVWRLVKARNPAVAVLASGDEHLRACFEVGTDGSQVSLAALFPALVIRLYRAVGQRDWHAATSLHNQIYPLAAAIYREAPGYLATARLKSGLRLRGQIETDAVRAPARRLTDPERTRLAKVMLEFSQPEVALVRKREFGVGEQPAVRTSD